MNVQTSKGDDSFAKWKEAITNWPMSDLIKAQLKAKADAGPRFTNRFTEALEQEIEKRKNG